MIKKHSDDPDVAHAATQALAIINEVLEALPKAQTFDYGGHDLHIGEYEVCERCTVPIAEAQAAHDALTQRAEATDDETVKEHLQLAAEFFRLEAEAAVVRAELHNGMGTEPILNKLLGFQYTREIHDDYQHSHHPGV
ncbi:MAG TPA: hypothetical protein VLH84_00395 [Patescibacteria group bacterium]|nr:hypothetical protein [Patescibacteria group bacterium]